jgi:Putative quorum-sensing-regulated virulence factor
MNLNRLKHELNEMKAHMDNIVRLINDAENEPLLEPANPNCLTDNDPIPFGKYRGRALGKLPQDYIDWLMAQDEIKHRGVQAWINSKRSKTNEPEVNTYVDNDVPF